MKKRDYAELMLMLISIGAHWSPFELEIVKRDKAELIQMVISIGAHWSPLELEIDKRTYAELIRVILNLTSSIQMIPFCWSQLELVELVELVEFIPKKDLNKGSYNNDPSRDGLIKSSKSGLIIW